MLNKVDRALDRLFTAIERVLAFALLAIICVNFANVIGRYLFSRTILGADEWQVYTMIWMTFLGAAVVTWRGEHLRMDVLVKRFPPLLARTLAVLEVVLLVTLAVFVVVESTRYTANMVGVSSAVGGIAMWIPHSSIVAGYGLIALIGLRQLMNGARA